MRTHPLRVGRRTATVRLIVFTAVILLITAGYPALLTSDLVHVSPFDSATANRVLTQQLTVLPLVAVTLLITALFARRTRLSYLSLRRTGPMRPLTGRGDTGRWETDGWTIGLIMTAIVGTVAFLQFLPGGYAFTWLQLVLVIPFAAMNAFSEEVLFRLPYVTMGAEATRSSVYGLVMGSGVFGVLHYWGVAPNGIVGALMSTLLGYFLSKSMQETHGFFWAWAIHFMLDVPVMMFVLNQA